MRLHAVISHVLKFAICDTHALTRLVILKIDKTSYIKVCKLRYPRIDKTSYIKV